MRAVEAISGKKYIGELKATIMWLDFSLKYLGLVSYVPSEILANL